MQRSDSITTIIKPANEQYIIIVFQLDNDFYKLSFEERFEILKKKLLQLLEAIKDWPANIICILVAPEYLFKDLSKKSQARYFTHAQKLRFINEIKEISKGSKLIIIPGTICWYKVREENQTKYFRNTAYLFYDGSVQKYHKKHPAWQDGDYLYDENDKKIAKVRHFKRAKSASPLLKVGEKIIGMEICFDHVNNHLQKWLQKNNIKKIDMHIVLADGVGDVNLLPIDNTVFIKVERNKWNSIFGIKSYVGKLSFPELEAPKPRLLKSQSTQLIKHSKTYQILKINEKEKMELMEEFKHRFLMEYSKQSLKNPFNTMKQMIDKGKIKNFEMIEYYVAINPNSFAAKIYRNLMKDKLHIHQELKPKII